MELSKIDDSRRDLRGSRHREKNLFPVVGGARAADLLPTNENTAGRIAALWKVYIGGYTNLNTRMKSSSLFSSSSTFFSTPRRKPLGTGSDN